MRRGNSSVMPLKTCSQSQMHMGAVINYSVGHPPFSTGAVKVIFTRAPQSFGHRF